jgi:heme-degrading monooxygenase HmoA
MAVLISTIVKGQTEEGYSSVLTAVREEVKKAPGFIFHCAHPNEEGWLVTEVWNSKKEADQWFARFVVPNLPSGIHPKRSYQELYSLVTPTK